MSTLLASLPIDLDAASGVADALRPVVTGRVTLPSDAAYDAARRVWNGAVDHRPAVIVCCEGTADVQAAVRAARSHGLRLAVRGGGHDMAGRAVVDGGLVVDLTRMREVTVDPEAAVATVAGGATARDLITAAAPHRVVAVTGNRGSVGVAGLTLGGGYGPLAARYGLAVDNLLGAEVVLADGRCVWTDATTEPDLFWALRGGGGNFGVVTAMRVRLHPVSELLAGWVVYPGEEVGTVLRHFAAFSAAAPDELGVLAALMTDPGGAPAVVLAPFWTGDRARGEAVLRALRDFGTVRSAAVGPTTYAEMLAQFDRLDGARAAGLHYAGRTRWLPALSAGAVDALGAALARRTSPHSIVGVQHLHGAPTRVASDATAFGGRREHVIVNIMAAWEPDESGVDGGAAHRRWAAEVWDDLAPFAMPGGYANLLGPRDREQAAHAYGGNGERLRALKLRYDPDNVFASAIPLPEG